MAPAIVVAPRSPDPEHQLAAFGLSTELVHTAMRPGLSRAMNRTAKALRSTPGTDIYHDAMEHLHRLLAETGWRLTYVDHQPRLVHPDGIVALAIASGVNVSSQDRRHQPRTRRKGKATRASLAVRPAAESAALFELAEVGQQRELEAAALKAPLWLLVHERTTRGLNLELSRPSGMTESGIVTEWDERIPIAFLDLDGDLSIFDRPSDGEIDVSIERI